ncbi:hypothetical protein [uncultured Jatrophihabitans sp.]|uniref:hypothetical protein n=1 Tax=uncultured Jatrophihabitans sp. TaxID=1610747 RepID=UPI0035C99436
MVEDINFSISGPPAEYALLGLAHYIEQVHSSDLNGALLNLQLHSKAIDMYLQSKDWLDARQSQPANWEA